MRPSKSSASICVIAVLLQFGTIPANGQVHKADQEFPVQPELLVDEPFGGCEGITFNGEGRLFATCNAKFWEIKTDLSVVELAELHSNLGAAGIGERDILVADFGPTNAFRNGRNTDGIVWRFTPEGEKTEDDASAESQGQGEEQDRRIELDLDPAGCRSDP